MNNSSYSIRKREKEIDNLQHRMNKIILCIQQKQIQLRKEIEELQFDDESETLVNHQWDPKNIDNIDQNLK